MNSFIVKIYLIPLSIIVTFLLLSVLLLQLGRATAMVGQAFFPAEAPQAQSGQAVAGLGP